MSLSSAAGWNRVTDLVARCSGRGAAVPKRIIPAAVELASSRLAAGPDCSGKNDGWLFKRVVQRWSDFVLESDDRPAATSEAPLRIYVVEQIEGGSLLLKAERHALCGWAEANQVVAVEEAIDFFSKGVDGDPKDAFPFLMRGLLWTDKKEFDNAIAKRRFEKAIADFTEAIRITPGEAEAYLHRGNAYTRRSESMTKPRPISTRPLG
jgi:tetratricopeptide (TPR) repeat protein